MTVIYNNIDHLNGNLVEILYGVFCTYFFGNKIKDTASYVENISCYTHMQELGHIQA